MLRSGEGVEVGPGAEYFEGGIAVDERFATSVPGLYAAGECAGSVFGANRVAAATMEMLVMGARAGWAAAEESADAALAALDSGAIAGAIERLCEPLARRSGPRPADVRKELQERSQEKLGPIRTAAELEEYLETLDGLEREVRSSLATASDSRVYNKEWIEALDLASMVTVCGLAARAALARTESRGVHFREDHPETDNDGWLKQIVLRDQDGEPALSTRPVRATNVAPPAGTLPYMEMIKRMMEAHSDVGGHH
jgi:succinate dehydrogenase/fumarate reductase flavoprotein subunit